MEINDVQVLEVPIGLAYRIRVNGGWIYVFRGDMFDGNSVSSQFVPD